MIIQTVSELRAAMRQGPYAWPGGYPLFFVTEDGDALSYQAVRAERRLVLEAVAGRDNSGGWRVIGVEVNWEDTTLICAHTGKAIQSAYGEN